MIPKKLMLALVTALALTACGSNDSTPTKATTDTTTTQTPEEAPNPQTNPVWETVHVGSELNYPPFEFLNEQGQAIGFEVDLLQEIGKREEFNVHFFNHERSEIAETLNNGKYRIWATALAVTPERTSMMDFSDPIITSHFVVALPDNETTSSIRSLSNLNGKIISVSKNASSTFDSAVRIAGKEANVLSTDTFFLSIKAMFSGQSTAVISDQRVLNYYALQYPTIGLKTFPLSGETRQLAFAVKKGDKTMLDKLNSGLKKVKDDGTYDQLMTKWFGTTK